MDKKKLVNNKFKFRMYNFCSWYWIFFSLIASIIFVIEQDLTFLVISLLSLIISFIYDLKNTIVRLLK
jgi:hypothetical protein